MTETAAKSSPLPVRSLPIALWPEADRMAWETACRPAERLRAGGRAAHLALITRRDLERRYGYFLGFLARTGRLDRDAPAAHQVTPENVRGYVEELQGRVGSVTLYGSIYKLRRAAQFINPGLEVGWLKELEADLDLLKTSR